MTMSANQPLGAPGSRARRDLLTALCAAFPTADKIYAVLEDLGFPPGQHPAAGENRQVEVVWRLVLRDLDAGRVVGGPERLLRLALDEFPANPVFRFMAGHPPVNGDGVEDPQSSEPIRILMLAANPQLGARLALDEEAREITEKLRLAQGRDHFDLITRWAVRPADLLQSINEHRPHVVHFSGHGARTGEIVLAADDRGQQHVTPEAIAAVFRATPDNTRIVLLNACYSAVQAQEIGRYVDFIIGMQAPIDDRSAIIFAASFYSAIGFGRSVQQAFDQGVAALMLNGMPDHDVPQLLVRQGVDPKQAM